jgi:hypothetical protein
MLILQKGINTRNNIPIVYIKGDTFNIRNQLGKNGLGLNWYGVEKMWWIYENNLSQSIISGLNKLGIDISVITNISQQQTDTSKTNSPIINKPEFQKPTNSPSLTNKTDTDKDAPSEKYYGFKVKENIYSISTKLKVDEIEYNFNIIMDRNYLTGKRKQPRYIYNVLYNGKLIGTLTEKPMLIGTYNEDQLALEIPKKIQARFDAKEKSKIYRAFKIDQELAQRDPELTEFLKTWYDIKYDKNKNVDEFVKNKIPDRTVKIDEIGYEGNFPIKLELLSNTIYVYPNVNHPLAPHEKILTTIEILPEIRNIKQLNQYIDKKIIDDDTKIKERYIEYLKSFPYKQEEQKASEKSMNVIVDMIGKNFDVDFFKNKLVEYGYIRPNKRTKQQGEGMVPQGSIKYVLDDNKIRDDVYGSKLRNQPEYFYAVLAYYLMRKVRNITSWTEIMLVTWMESWVNLANRYNKNLVFKDIDNYLGQLVKLIYRNLYKQEAPKDRTESYEDFYNWFNEDQGTSGEQKTRPSGNALNIFVQFATKLGINSDVARNKPRSAYRELSKKYHPDLNPNNLEATEIMKILNALYHALPGDVIEANNWWQKIILANKQ